MGHEHSPADVGQHRSPGRAKSAAEASRPGEGSLVLYVHEEPGGRRVLTGGGITSDGIYADIFASLCPGGVWNGVPYESLLPGRYDIVGDALVRADGGLVPLSE